VSWFSLVIGQNASHQLVTSCENLVASAQFLVVLATSESQFQALSGKLCQAMVHILERRNTAKLRYAMEKPN